MQWVTEGHLTRVIHSSPLRRQRILSSYRSFQTFTSLYYNIISLPASTPKATTHQQKAPWPCHSPVASAVTHCSFQYCPNPQQHTGSFLSLRASLQAPLSLPLTPHAAHAMPLSTPGPPLCTSSDSAALPQPDKLLFIFQILTFLSPPSGSPPWFPKSELSIFPRHPAIPILITSWYDYIYMCVCIHTYTHTLQLVYKWGRKTVSCLVCVPPWESGKASRPCVLFKWARAPSLVHCCMHARCTAGTIYQVEWMRATNKWKSENSGPSIHSRATYWAPYYGSKLYTLGHSTEQSKLRSLPSWNHTSCREKDTTLNK